MQCVFYLQLEVKKNNPKIQLLVNIDFVQQKHCTVYSLGMFLRKLYFLRERKRFIVLIYNLCVYVRVENISSSPLLHSH